MKTLADFKKALVPGSLWLRKHVKEDDWIERKVKKVRTKDVIFDTCLGEVHLDFPKASEIEFTEDGIVNIFYPECKIYEKPRRLVVSYKKV